MSCIRVLCGALVARVLATVIMLLLLIGATLLIDFVYYRRTWVPGVVQPESNESGSSSMEVVVVMEVVVGVLMLIVWAVVGSHVHHQVDELSVVEGGYGTFRIPGNQVEEFDWGYCYLRFVKVEYRQDVREILGAWPSVVRVLSFSDEIYDLRMLCSMRVVKEADKVWHVASGGDYWLVDLLYSAALCLDTMGEGTFYQWLIDAGVGNEIVGVTSRDLIGGEFPFERCLDRVLSSQDDGLCRSMFDAMACYYGSGSRVDVGVVEEFRKKLMIADAPVTVGVAAEPEVKASSGLSTIGVGKPGGDVGPNWARNQEWRREKKLKKQRRNARKYGPVGATNAGVGIVPGFFSECDEGTRKQLRDSRADLLIAKNKRELAEVNRRVSQLDSSEMIVQDMLRLVKVSDALKKKTKDTRIGGWAATLVDTVVERSASSVPNSVPSLTEVGLSDSVSQNGKDDRKKEYERKRAAIETEFENMEYYAGFEYDNAVADLKREYIDALCGESELAERKLINRVYQEYSKMYMECTKGIVSADAVLDMIADIKKEVEVEL